MRAGGISLLIECSTPSSIEDLPVGEGREYRKTRSAMPSGQHGVGVSEVARGEAFGGRHNSWEVHSDASSVRPRPLKLVRASRFVALLVADDE